MLKFELTKILRQRKLVISFLAILLFVVASYAQNHMQQEKKTERAQDRIADYVSKTDELYAVYRGFQREERLSEKHAVQFGHLNKMATDLFQWKSAIYKKEWELIPEIEHSFLINLEGYMEAGGIFWPLQGLEFDQAKEKNNWIRDHNLPYEDEAYPVSPFLFLKEMSTYLFGVYGLVFLLILFGQTYTSEHEQNTDRTLKTQPIQQWKHVVAKYASLLLVMSIYAVFVIGISLLIPTLFGNGIWNAQYPQILLSEGSFLTQATWSYVGHSLFLFGCGGLFLFGLLAMVSAQFKSTFTALIVTSAIVLFGVFTTNTFGDVRSVWNPFQLIQIGEITTTSIVHLKWMYGLSALVWSGLLLGFSTFLPMGNQNRAVISRQLNPFRNGDTRLSSPIVNNVVFEWRKSQRQGILRSTLLVMAVTIVVGYFIVTQLATASERKYMESLSLLIDRYTMESLPRIADNLESMESDLQKAIEAKDEGKIFYYQDGKAQSYLEEKADIIHYEISLLKSTINGYEQGDWKSLYDYQLFLLKDHYAMDDEMKKFGNPSPHSYFMFEASIEEKEWLMEHNIRPVFSGEYIPVIFQNWNDDDYKEQSKWEDFNLRVDNSGLYSLYMYSKSYIYLIPLLILLFIVGSGFSGERGKKPTLRLLQTMPVTKNSIFLGKVMFATLIGAASSVSLLLFVVAVGTLFNRFGDWMYPVLHYDNKIVVEMEGYSGTRAFEGGFHFIPIGEYLLKFLLLFVFLLVFFIVLSHVLSIFIAKPIGVFVTLAILSTIGYYVSGELGGYALFVPFTYLDIPRIVNGEISTLLNNPGITVLNGCFLFMGISAVLLFGGMLILRAKSFTKVRRSGEDRVATSD